MSHRPEMRRVTVAFVVLLWASSGEARTSAPIYDSNYLNIGLGCQWQQKCMAKQQKAMKKALKFVQKHDPPAWRIHLCNRNAARTRYRVDWVGFENCIRNAALREPPPRPVKRPQGKPAHGEIASRSRGERG